MNFFLYQPGRRRSADLSDINDGAILQRRTACFNAIICIAGSFIDLQYAGKFSVIRPDFPQVEFFRFTEMLIDV